MDSINSGIFMAESMNLVPNHQIYQGDLTTGEDAIMSGSSMKPLIREPPEPGRQAPIRGKQFVSLQHAIKFNRLFSIALAGYFELYVMTF